LKEFERHAHGLQVLPVGRNARFEKLKKGNIVASAITRERERASERARERKRETEKKKSHE
jgi:hypothetical protein